MRIPSAPVPVVVSVMFAPSTSFTEPPVDESVTVCDVASAVLATVWSPVFVPLAVPVHPAAHILPRAVALLARPERLSLFSISHPDAPQNA